jgi:hypothetical protein
MRGSKKIPSAARHAAKCRICRHPKRQEIEADFVGWKSPARIARDYGLRNRASIDRHAEAVGLKGQRRRNVRAALERIIEQAGEVEATPSSVVAAVSVYVNLNQRGEWLEREDVVDLTDLFDRMASDEYEAYAKDGTLPSWFRDALSAFGASVKGDTDKN